MSYTLLLWKPKRRTTLGRGAIALVLSEGLPCDAAAKLPCAKLKAALGAMCGEGDDPAFLFAVDEKRVVIDIAWSKVEAVASKIVQFAKRARLEVHDPQREHTSREDHQVLEAARRRNAVDANEGAFDRWRRWAEAGDAAAMNELATCYAFGDGVDADQRLAFEWYQRAAEAGSTSASFNLAQAYRFGDGVERDPARAVRLYEDLLEKDPCVSAFELGRMWETGEGVPRSLEKAAEYFRLARANRHPEAYVALKRIGFAPAS